MTRLELWVWGTWQIGANPTAVVVPIVIIAVLIVVIFLAVGPGGLMVRASDWYSECLGFESQLDPRFFFYFSPSAKIKNTIISWDLLPPKYIVIQAKTGIIIACNREKNREGNGRQRKKGKMWEENKKREDEGQYLYLWQCALVSF